MSIKCNKCLGSNFSFIKKVQSNKDIRLGKEMQFVICQDCEPLLSKLSFEQIQEAYIDLSKKTEAPK